MPTRNTAQSTKKKSFLLYKDFDEQLNSLTNEQAGQYLKSIYAYQNGYEFEVDDPLVKFALAGAVSQFKRDEFKYLDKVAKCSDAGRKSAERRLANAGKRKRKSTDSTVEDEVVVEDRVTVEDKLLSLPAEAVRISDMIVDHVRSLNPKQKNINHPKLNKTRLAWSIDIDRLNRIDGREFVDIEKMWNWIIRDEFWRINILCGAKLREKYDKLLPRMDGSKQTAKLSQEVDERINDLCEKGKGAWAEQIRKWVEFRTSQGDTWTIQQLESFIEVVRKEMSGNGVDEFARCVELSIADGNKSMTWRYDR